MFEKTVPEFVGMADAVREFAKDLDRQTENDFFSTGFASHDQVLGRLRRGSITFVGARPSIGKTAFMLSMARQQVKAGSRVYFFTLEMPRSDMIARLVSIETRIPLLDILERRYTIEQARQMVGAFPTLSSLSCDWSEEDNLKRIGELFARIEPKSQSIVYFDFLGLIELPGLDAGQQYAITTQIGLTLKRAAMQLQIPVVAGVQLNRQLEMRKEKFPALSDFRDSGRLEEIGDLCLGLHRPGFYEKNIPDNELQVFCLKNRNGPRANYVLDWYGPCARISEKKNLPWIEVA